jgi:uncharacterized protein YjbI with pentapeptide repeats
MRQFNGSAQDKLNITQTVFGFVRKHQPLVKWLLLAVFFTVVATLAYRLNGEQKSSSNPRVESVEVQSLYIAAMGLSLTLGWCAYEIFDRNQQRHKQRRVDAWDRLSVEAGKLPALEYLNSQGDSFQGLTLKDAQLENAQLEKADFCKANLSGSSLKNANLAHANLSDADLRDTDLTDADLTGSNLSGAKLNRAKLNGSNLEGANLSHAMMTNANALRSNLERANLRNAELDNVDFRHSNLRYADLNGANLEGSRFKRAELTGAIMPDGSIYSSEHRLDG